MVLLYVKYNYPIILTEREISQLEEFKLTTNCFYIAGLLIILSRAETNLLSESAIVMFSKKTEIADIIG